MSAPAFSLRAACGRQLGHSALQTGCTKVDTALGGGGLAYPTVLELVGPSGAGKTEFILDMCAANILPKTFKGVHVGGAPACALHCFCPPRPWPCCRAVMFRALTAHVSPGPGASVVYFSVGAIASALIVRLVTLLDLHLMGKREEMGKECDWAQWRASFIDDCLSRVHIVACSGTLQVSLSSVLLPTGSSWCLLPGGAPVAPSVPVLTVLCEGKSVRLTRTFNSF